MPISPTNLTIASGLLVLVGACSQKLGGSPTAYETQQRAVRSQQELEVLEAVLKAVVRQRDWPEVWFVGFARIADTSNEIFDPFVGDDPPAEFLARFADLPDSFRPLSRAVFGEYVVKDVRTGEEGWIATACVVRWHDKDTAEVLYQDYHDPVAASGARALVRRTGDGWEITERCGWVSYRGRMRDRPLARRTEGAATAGYQASRPPEPQTNRAAAKVCPLDRPPFPRSHFPTLAPLG